MEETKRTYGSKRKRQRDKKKKRCLSERDRGRERYKMSSPKTLVRERVKINK